MCSCEDATVCRGIALILMLMQAAAYEADLDGDHRVLGRWLAV